MNIFCVYALIDPRNNLPFYIGKGIYKDSRGRELRRVKYHLSLKDKSNRLKNAVIKKLRAAGLEINHQILGDNLSEDESFALEKEFIHKYGRRDNNTGILCNLTDGGEGMCGHKHNEDTRKLMSDKKKEYIEKNGVPFKGCRHNAESRKKMSDSQQIVAKNRINPMQGKKHSEEAKRKISEKASLRTGEKNVWFGKQLHPNTVARCLEVCREKFKGSGNPFYGKAHSTESRAKISQALSGRKQSVDFCKNQEGNTRGAKSYLITDSNGESVKITNLQKFCDEKGLHAPNAFQAIKSGKPYRGYYFKSAA